MGISKALITRLHFCDSDANLFSAWLYGVFLSRVALLDCPSKTPLSSEVVSCVNCQESELRQTSFKNATKRRY